MDRVLNEDQKPSLLGANSVFLIILLLMIFVKATAFNFIPEEIGSESHFLILLIFEFALIGIPALLYMKFRNINIKRTARFNKMDSIEILFVIGLAVLGFFVTGGISIIWNWIISHWGTPIGQNIPAIETFPQYLMALLAVGVAPAIAEEFVFRGLMLRGYEKFGSRAAIIMSGLLFGMMHLQLASMPPIILLGMVISYIAYRTNSIYAGMIYHFIHNSISVSILFIGNIILEKLGDAGGVAQDISQIPKEELKGVMIIWGIVGSVCLTLFIALMIGFHFYTTKKRQKGSIDIPKLKARRMISYEMVPCGIAMAIIIANLILEALYMAGKLSV